MEIVISFILGFVITWVFMKTEDDISTMARCPNKDVIVRIAEEHGKDKKMMRELKEYSLIQIQQGNYEYKDVLQTLIHTEKS